MKKIISTGVAALCAACAVGGTKGVGDLFPEGVKTIGIVSVSSILPRHKLDLGTNFLVKCGYKVKMMPNVPGPDVAPAEVRARLFEEAWLDPSVDLLLFARGGSGAEDVIGLIDWEKLRARDMRVIGFSDVTLVVNAMLAKGVGHPYSGPMLSSVGSWSDESRSWFGSMLNGKPVNPIKVKVLKAGAAKGLPMGGHIMRMGTLSKTALMPSAKGRIVFFECTARYPPEDVLANLVGLRDGGFLKGAAAVVFCDFRHKDKEGAKMRAFVRDFAKSLDCPVYAGYPYGHCRESRLLDFRREVSISEDGVLSWLDDAPVTMRNIAHRGMWDKDVPQNTVEAIKRAYDAGATWVETDFHHTKSGQMVCIHAGKELKKYTGCTKNVVDLTPEDVATLNLGAKDGLAKEYRIPLLDQVLAVVPKHGVLQSEIKGYSPQYADLFEAAVKAAGLSESNIVVSSFNYPALKDFKARYPKYRTVWLISLPRDKAFSAEEYAAKCKAAGIETFCPGCRSTKGTMTRKDADAIRATGLEFRMFGVNSPDDLRQAKALGASGFTCNFWHDAFGWASDIGGIALVR